MKIKTLARFVLFALLVVFAYASFATDAQTQQEVVQSTGIGMPVVIALGIIIAVLIAMLAYSAINIVKLKNIAKQNDEIIKTTIFDSVTGLMTRQKFCDEAETMLKNAVSGGYILLSIDIDAFRIINEVYGYKTGTKVLKNTADTIKTCYGENCLIGRDKDDVFLILKKDEGAKNNLDNKETCELAIKDCIKQLLGEHYDINLSQGGYTIKDTTDPISKMIDLSNSARLKGKKKFGTTYYEFTQQMQEYREKRNRIVFSMESAMKREEFTLQYQPKIDLNTFEIAGAEALVRWTTNSGDTIRPDEFIEVFEENGFIYELDCYVLAKACKFIKEHKHISYMPKIAINISGHSLLKPNIRQTLTRILNEHNVGKHQIELEIAEGFLVGEKSIVESKLKDLRDNGFTLTMDDFGSGASSLSKLRGIKIDIIKLDKEFLNYGLTETRGTIIIGNIIKLSKNLLMQIVAEGVETKDHLHILKYLKCDMAQGYYFEKPLNEQDFVNILVERKDYKHLSKT